MENVLGSVTANSSAPTLTISETHCETLVSSLGLASGLKNSLKMFRARTSYPEVNAFRAHRRRHYRVILT